MEVFVLMTFHKLQVRSRLETLLAAAFAVSVVLARVVGLARLPR
jgi:hypothetical protein